MTSAINSYSTGSYFGVTSDFFKNSSNKASGNSYVSDFSNIRSGSYYKLMKAYYSGNSNATSLVDSSSEKKAAERINAIAVRDEASALKKSAASLLKTGTDSLFNKKTVKDDKGNESEGYDTNSIYKSVSSFVDNYNDLIKSTADSGNNAVLTSAASMVGSTRVNEELLDSVGITVGSDNTLSIDEKQFKAADVSTIKSLFNGTGSYGYRISAGTTNIYNQSVSQLAQLATGTSYSSSGSYNYNYSGSLYNSQL